MAILPSQPSSETVSPPSPNEPLTPAPSPTLNPVVSPPAQVQTPPSAPSTPPTPSITPSDPPSTESKSTQKSTPEAEPNSPSTTNQNPSRPVPAAKMPSPEAEKTETTTALQPSPEPEHKKLSPLAPSSSSPSNEKPTSHPEQAAKGSPPKRSEPYDFDPFATTYEILRHSSTRPFVDHLAMTHPETLTKYLSNLLSTGYDPPYFARPAGLAQTLFSFLKQSRCKVEISQQQTQKVFSSNAKIQELEAIFFQYPQDYFYFYVDGQVSKIDADRRIVINLNDIADAAKIINALIEVMVPLPTQGNIQANNPFQIEQFKVLLNSDPMYRKMKLEKIVIYYKSGSTSLKPPYFDTHGIGILKALASLIAHGGGKDHFFPFYLPAVLEEIQESGASQFSTIRGAAWGEENVSNRSVDFSELRVHALSSMLTANGRLPDTAASFKRDLQYFFKKAGIDPEAPWALSPENLSIR